jgi:biotin carboxyl carrier protein
MRFVVTQGSETIAVEVDERAGRCRVRLGEEWLDVDARPLGGGGSWSLLIDAASYVADVLELGRGDLAVTVGGETYRFQVEEPGARLARRAAAGAGGSGQRLVAPMPGRVVAVHVRPGYRVAPGAPLVVLEAMKMENEFRATGGGVVAEVAVASGQAVNAGDLLVVVTPASA